MFNGTSHLGNTLRHMGYKDKGDSLVMSRVFDRDLYLSTVIFIKTRAKTLRLQHL